MIEYCWLFKYRHFYFSNFATVTRIRLIKKYDNTAVANKATVIFQFLHTIARVIFANIAQIKWHVRQFSLSGKSSPGNEITFDKGTNDT